MDKHPHDKSKDTPKTKGWRWLNFASVAEAERKKMLKEKLKCNQLDVCKFDAKVV